MLHMLPGISRSWPVCRVTMPDSQTYQKWIRKTSVLNICIAASTIAFHEMPTQFWTIDWWMTIQIHGRNPISDFSIFFLSCTGLQVITSKGRVPDAPDSGTWFVCCWVRPNKTNLDSFTYPSEHIRKNQPGFSARVCFIFFNNGWEIGKLSTNQLQAFRTLNQPAEG